MKKLLIISLLVASCLTVTAQEVPRGITRAFETGDARALSAHLFTNVELKVNGTSNVSSKAQATKILNNFFKDHPPTSFRINYEGNRTDSSYLFGTLSTKKGTYRVNLYFLEGRSEKVIYSIIIEKT